MDFVKSKRAEFYRMRFMTAVGVVSTAIGIAAYRGHANRNVIVSILAWNVFGEMVNAYLSIRAGRDRDTK